MVLFRSPPHQYGTVELAIIVRALFTTNLTKNLAFHVGFLFSLLQICSFPLGFHCYRTSNPSAVIAGHCTFKNDLPLFAHHAAQFAAQFAAQSALTKQLNCEIRLGPRRNVSPPHEYLVHTYLYKNARFLV